MSAKRSKEPGERHRWEFAARFRRNAFGWKSRPAIERIAQAVAEIKKVARRDPLLAAEGAVRFLERVSPAIEHVDGSSGAIGSAVNRAIDALVPILAKAPADPETREAWLERLWEAQEEDRIPYIERLGERWGELCGSPEAAYTWADRLLGPTRVALQPDRSRFSFFRGTTACLSALHRAGRHREIVELVSGERRIWAYSRWVVAALAAEGQVDEALQYAESCRPPLAPDPDIDALCEEILLAAGRVDEAYARYALRASGRGTYLATFRAVARKYPEKQPQEILADLVQASPGDEGKWFTAAKELGLLDTAIELARASPCDPRTLARAARDHAASEPAFAVQAGCAALEWIARGVGYELTGGDVWLAYAATLKAAEALGQEEPVRERMRELARGPRSLVTEVLSRELGLGP